MAPRSAERIVYEAVTKYANAYALMQDCQDEHSDIIPMGDQKTGCVGEFYSLLWLRHHHRHLAFRFAQHSNKAWDIGGYDGDILTLKTQVKTVSVYNAKRRMSPIHRGWDQLLVLFLNKALWPEGFWIIKDCSFVGENEPLAGCTCPVPSGTAPGSQNIAFGVNRIDELLVVLRQLRASENSGNHGDIEPIS